MYNHQITVEFEDVDTYGIVHHTKTISYLERTRVHFFADNGSDIRSLPFGVVITKLDVQFKLPLLMMDKIDIELRVKNIEKIKFEWDYKIRKDGKLAVKATIQQVVIDLATKRIIPIPEHMRTILEKILIEDE